MEKFITVIEVQCSLDYNLSENYVKFVNKTFPNIIIKEINIPVVDYVGVTSLFLIYTTNDDFKNLMLVNQLSFNDKKITQFEVDNCRIVP